MYRRPMCFTPFLSSASLNVKRHFLSHTHVVFFVSVLFMTIMVVLKCLKLLSVILQFLFSFLFHRKTTA